MPPNLVYQQVPTREASWSKCIHSFENTKKGNFMLHIEMEKKIRMMMYLSTKLLNIVVLRRIVSRFWWVFFCLFFGFFVCLFVFLFLYPALSFFLSIYKVADSFCYLEWIFLHNHVKYQRFLR